MKLKAALLAGIGRFLGLASLLEIALLLIVGVAALLTGARTVPEIGSLLFYAGAAAIIAGIIPGFGTTFAISQKGLPLAAQFDASEMAAQRRGASSRAMRFALLAAVVGGAAIILSMIISAA